MKSKSRLSASERLLPNGPQVPGTIFITFGNGDILIESKSDEVRVVHVDGSVTKLQYIRE